MTSEKQDRRYFYGLVIGALGVVYGDIGTSPLYALRECFHGPHALPAVRMNVLGVLSLIFWALVVLISLKYLTFVTRASNKGEGGILSLLSLAVPERVRRKATGKTAWLVAAGVFGSALLYGDGMITPAISVLSAVEGLQVIEPGLKPFVLPITVVILVLFFSFQRFGTAGVGRIFGPVTFLWFTTLGTLGVLQVVKAPEVLWSLNPYYAIQFFTDNGWPAFVVLGSVVLVVTGGEALYADMGHFGRKPMQYAWFGIVLPGLLLNYFGQGALILTRPEAIENPFFRLAPEWALYPLVALATAATIIASQALVTGAFSLTMQAIQLGYSPRMEIDHTSAAERGQIYMPKINWLLMVFCIGLVLTFQTSSNLASAYGIAVTLTMLTTTLLFYFAARHLWKWSPLKALLTCALFLPLEIAFLVGNLPKIPDGGWFPLLVAGCIFLLMSTWRTGRRILGDRLKSGTLPLATFLEEIQRNSPQRVKGTSIFLSGNPEGTPLALMHNLKHNQVLHEQVVIMTIQTLEVPHADKDERVQVQELAPNFYRVIGAFGFMEDPDIPTLLKACKEHGLEFNQQKTTFFLSRETIIASSKPGMMVWRERLFSLMSRNAQSATAFFRLPPNRVVELGMQVEI